MLAKRRIAHARGYLELGMLAEAAAELALVPEPENAGLGFQGVRLALLQEQQDWPALRDCARDYAHRVPEEAAAWVTWAYAARRADSITAARKVLLEAIPHHPANGTIQFNLACYASQLGELTDARHHLELAIALDKEFAKAAVTDPDLAPLRDEKAGDERSGA
ncbi:MAG: hypothetical protein ABIQ12_06500 [Opitutaceae bacterium]